MTDKTPTMNPASDTAIPAWIFFALVIATKRAALGARTKAVRGCRGGLGH